MMSKILKGRISATSTPNNRSETQPLMDLQQSKIEKKETRNPQPKEEKKRLARSSKPFRKVAKENVSQPIKIPQSRQRMKDDKKQAQRRQQALEAMQIHEQRRQRMTQEEALAEELSDLTLKSPEGRDAIMEKKRLEAKRLKEKRILAHLAEQEARKNQVAESSVRNRSLSAPRMLPPKIISTRPKPKFQAKPKKFIYSMPQLPKLPEVDEPVDVAQAEPARYQHCIRYTKDEIRSLNPYGFYFM